MSQKNEPFESNIHNNLLFFKEMFHHMLSALKFNKNGIAIKIGTYTTGTKIQTQKESY